MGLEQAGRTAVRQLTTVVVSAQILTLATLFSATNATAQLTPAPMSGVTGIKEGALGGDANRTRFVIGLEKIVDFQVTSIGSPHRIFVDMPEVKLQLPTSTGAAPIGLVKSFYGGVAAPGKTRVVIDVTGPVVVETSRIETSKDGKPPRLVLEIVPLDAAKATLKKASIPSPSSLGAQSVAAPPAPKLAQRPKQRDGAVYKPVIVIDPGHGGHDSGATKFGAVEKDVVLAFSHKLREKLEQSGRYKVLMTRTNDTFVALDDRRAFGDNNRAALFIAVHADYAGSGARGATIYSLKDATSKSLQRSAKEDATENVLSQKEVDGVKKSQGDVSAVTGILKSLAEREVASNKDRTETFSKSVINFMGGSTPMQNNPDREANFRVLKSAKTPSVLIELAYVTNQQDAQNLRSDAWRDKVSNSLVTAIHNYFTHQVAQLPF
jgi:N-acetylmuramoyl-L-alanine amidase